MLTSPPETFRHLDELERDGQSFVLATVIAVRGATSAKTGSKAIFNAAGLNLHGWVGGGCAESFLARESLAALDSKTARIVTVDLDDEVFGLMPCGGVMDVYLEPYFAAPALPLQACGPWQESVSHFVQQLGFEPKFSPGPAASPPATWAEAFCRIARGLAQMRNVPLIPWREAKGQSHLSRPRLSEANPQLIVLGQTRITEELCRFAKLLGWTTTLFVQNAQGEGLPAGTAVCEIPIDPSSLEIPAHAWVVVASHHQRDHEFIAHALRQKADYVALVASEKRASLIQEDLRQKEFSTLLLGRYFAPAGLNLPSDTPTQIAFAIACELLYLSDSAGGERWT